MPSEIIGIEDEYTAYCFDECIAYITSQLDAGKQVNFKAFKDAGGVEKVSSFSELYRKYEV